MVDGEWNANMSRIRIKGNQHIIGHVIRHVRLEANRSGKQL